MSERTTKADIPSFYQDLIEFVRGHSAPDEIESHLRDLARSATIETSSYFDPELRAAGHRVYDDIIRDIFTSVIRAVSREALLLDTLDKLWAAKASRATVCFFIVEAGSDAASPLRGVSQRGLNEHLWRNYVADIQDRLPRSQLFLDLFIKSESIPLWLSAYIPTYAGEFDMLLRTVQKHGRHSKGCWISAVVLKSGPRNRALIALYENRGDDVDPKLPPGANQEWRVLQFLAVAYQVLQHQLASVAEEVHSQRQRLLSLLAPGILHHEIGIQISSMMDVLWTSAQIVTRIEGVVLHEDVERLRDNLRVVTDIGTRLDHIADAFNNMERRRAMELIAVEDILDEIQTLTHHRIGKVGALFQWEPRPMEFRLETDPALLLHLLLNIVINGMNAFEESSSSGRCICVSAAVPSPGSLKILITNNGPAIPEEHLERVFEKGFTTRPSGHGHGLYIARLIAGTLGGTLRALSAAELPVEWSVGFELSLPFVAQREVDLIGERRSPRK